MKNKNYKIPATDLMLDNEGNMYSLVEVLKGNTEPISTGHKNYKQPNTAMIVDQEGNMYSLVDLIREAISNSIVSVTELPENPDENTWYAIQEDY